MDYDIKISGGTIVDGSGTEAYRGDVGVKDGKVVALGEAKGSAAETLDAEGKVVCPGFVDIHTHYDAQIMWDRMMTISPWHGVTTVVMGNCGFGIAPTRAEHRDLIARTLEKVEGMSVAALRAGLGEEWAFETFPEYLDTIDKLGTAINVAAMIGHTPLRMYVMGEEATERAATDAEVAAMRKIVREAIEAGALGFATSKANTHIGYEGRPVPSRLAEFSEIKAMAGAVREGGGRIIQSTAGAELFFSQFAELATEAECNVSWTALLAGMLGPGSHRSFLEQSHALQDQGFAVFPQVTCRPLNFEFTLEEPFPLESIACFKAISSSDHEGKMRVYADPDFRRQFKEADAGGGFMFGGRWQETTISYCPSEPDLEETNLAAVAESRGMHPIDLMIDIGLANELKARCRMGIMNTDEEEVEECLQDSSAVLGLSDAGAHASQLCDACFSTHLLGRWVRERKSLTLERAVQMLTSRPAQVFGISDRGLLATGRPADVVVFDPETVGAQKLRRVHDLPADADRLVADATGIDAVMCNGTVIRREGGDAVEPDGVLPGRLLRQGSA
jgi:N-acyl-D-aspartate/D-glutamate deacylase